MRKCIQFVGTHTKAVQKSRTCCQALCGQSLFPQSKIVRHFNHVRGSLRLSRPWPLIEALHLIKHQEGKIEPPPEEYSKEITWTHVPQRSSKNVFNWKVKFSFANLFAFKIGWICTWDWSSFPKPRSWTSTEPLRRERFLEATLWMGED